MKLFVQDFGRLPGRLKVEPIFLLQHPEYFGALAPLLLATLGRLLLGAFQFSARMFRNMSAVSYMMRQILRGLVDGRVGFGKVKGALVVAVATANPDLALLNGAIAALYAARVGGFKEFNILAQETLKVTKGFDVATQIEHNGWATAGAVVGDLAAADGGNIEAKAIFNLERVIEDLLEVVVGRFGEVLFKEEERIQTMMLVLLLLLGGGAFVT